MPLQEINPQEVKNRIFLYGENGAGKTDLAFSAPGKKLLIDWFSNAMPVAMRRYSKEFDKGEIKIVSGPTKWNDVANMVKMPLDPLVEWADVIILDNLTGLYRELTEDVAQNLPLKGESRPSPEMIIMRDYGLSAERLRYTLGKIMDHFAPTKHIIAIAHTKVEKDKEGSVISGGPSLPGQVPAYVLSLFPEQIFLRVTPDQVRHAHLTHTGLYPATTRSLEGKTIDKPNLSQMYKW